MVSPFLARFLYLYITVQKTVRQWKLIFLLLYDVSVKSINCVCLEQKKWRIYMVKEEQYY